MKKTAFQRNRKPRKTTHGFLVRMSSPEVGMLSREGELREDID